MNEIQGRHSRQWRGGDIQLTRLDMEIRVKEASGGKKNIIILRLTRCRNNEWFSASHCAAAASSLDKQERGGKD